VENPSRKRKVVCLFRDVNFVKDIFDFSVGEKHQHQQNGRQSTNHIAPTRKQKKSIHGLFFRVHPSILLQKRL
jgi:hypothetical protein